jgi:hypothetical protein
LQVISINLYKLCVKKARLISFSKTALYNKEVWPVER